MHSIIIKNKKYKPYFYSAIISWTLVGILCINYIVFAWNTPTANPPDGSDDVFIPLNVSNSSQEKAGALTIASIVNNGTALFKGISTFTPTSNSTSVFKITNTQGEIILNIDSTNKRVGIGISSPDNLLHLLGAGGNTQGIQIQNGEQSNYIYNDTTAGNLLTLIGVDGTQIKPSAASNKGLIIKGLASQSGNLLEIKDSQGNTLSFINASGSLSAANITSTGNITTSSGDVVGNRLCINDNCQEAWPGGEGVPSGAIIGNDQPNNQEIINAGYTYSDNLSITLYVAPGTETCPGPGYCPAGNLFIYEKN